MPLCTIFVAFFVYVSFGEEKKKTNSQLMPL